MQALLVTTGTVLLCGGAIGMWHLAAGLRKARLMIVALWLVLLAMALIAGSPFNLVMGAATVMMALIVWLIGKPWWI
ncbi:hypothetical protein [Paracoccus zhejiangensis]|uniref:Uncharacterized protein n=1 Tax=Paracoccus zhejiangensis TaxID=1077935 RepID=A0A2H5F257_9RHOB|nr:hypothetical protein [Paracoccus zhejiangensis]AUH65649.1 hypothetical protein CX676_17065 [Paracoccus zhejiangensis]